VNHTQTCSQCPHGCRPTAVNAIGTTVEEHHGAAGWVPVGKVHDTYCQASAALKQIPNDDVERRVYTAFRPTVPVPKKPVSLWSQYNAFITSCFSAHA
jgi:hypothetical protein